jgi:hypothetical protein
MGGGNTAQQHRAPNQRNRHLPHLPSAEEKAIIKADHAQPGRRTAKESLRSIPYRPLIENRKMLYNTNKTKLLGKRGFIAVRMLCGKGNANASVDRDSVHNFSLGFEIHDLQNGRKER